MEVPVKKNQEYIVDIIDNGFEGEGIAKIDNFTIFIPNSIKGEKVKILIVKVLSSHAFGKVKEILKKAESRIESDCYTYKRCGGCNLRHIQYSETLNMKRNAVQSLVNKTLETNIEVEETLGMEHPYHYRNKAQYPVGIDKEGKPVIGVFANRTHEIIPIENCLIQDEKTEEIAKYIVNYITQNHISIYNEKTRKGLIRHIVTKIGKRTDEIMVILVINGKEFPKEKQFVETLTSKFSNIKTIVKNINEKNTNVILGEKNITIYGEGYITDKLGELTFKISPLSFYQVNPIQAEKLYGIEIVKQAVEDAIENTKLNDIHNTEFIAGDVEEVLDDLINNKKIIPDIIMVDPPRRGLDKTSIQNILKIKPKKLVYISCNPATLVRDLKELEECYEINSIKPVDMFPFTSHVECVALMNRKEDKNK